MLFIVCLAQHNFMALGLPRISQTGDVGIAFPDSIIHGVNMWPTWVLSAPDRPHVGPVNLPIRDCYNSLHHPWANAWCFPLVPIPIRVASHEHHGVSPCQPLDCLFCRLFVCFFAGQLQRNMKDCTAEPFHPREEQLNVYISWFIKISSCEMYRVSGLLQVADNSHIKRRLLFSVLFGFRYVNSCQWICDVMFSTGTLLSNEAIIQLRLP